VHGEIFAGPHLKGVERHLVRGAVHPNLAGGIFAHHAKFGGDPGRYRIDLPIEVAIEFFRVVVFIPLGSHRNLRG